MWGSCRRELEKRANIPPKNTEGRIQELPRNDSLTPNLSEKWKFFRLETFHQCICFLLFHFRKRSNLWMFYPLYVCPEWWQICIADGSMAEDRDRGRSVLGGGGWVRRWHPLLGRTPAVPAGSSYQGDSMSAQPVRMKGGVMHHQLWWVCQYRLDPRGAEARRDTSPLREQTHTKIAPTVGAICIFIHCIDLNSFPKAQPRQITLNLTQQKFK